MICGTSKTVIKVNHMLGRKLHVGLIALLLFACTNLVFGEIIWGIPTNGISTGVEISHDTHQWHNNVFSPIEINVYLKRQGLRGDLDKWNIKEKMPGNDSLWWRDPRVNMKLNGRHWDIK
jgi:hypothetical protein